MALHDDVARMRQQRGPMPEALQGRRARARPWGILKFARCCTEARLLYHSPDASDKKLLLRDAL